MNSLKIFKYELKRLIFTKFYLVISALSILYSYNLLTTKYVMGLSSTAPFSQWSYSGFLCDMNTFLLLVVMFFCTYLFSKKEKEVREITRPTPMPENKYFMIKTFAIITTYLILCAAIITVSFIFYAQIFKFTDFCSFLLPMIIVLLPSLLLTIGLCFFLGNKNVSLIYVAMPVVIGLSILELGINPFLDVFAKGYITASPLLVPVDQTGEPLFMLSSVFVMSRVLFLVLGLALIWRALSKNRAK